ncbi:hypothetical protein EM6_1097 [Asticcacaulis excentricus]|uniref:Uncharacterized protein n=1 Tax=Asticcacaulis excentricus TaxID=78587 RepID=A0A3G9G5Z4_9CAUL|nr:hypothetical protein EM6_1097 [Asticcacaulis excentricus]
MIPRVIENDSWYEKHDASQGAVPPCDGWARVKTARGLQHPPRFCISGQKKPSLAG